MKHIVYVALAALAAWLLGCSFALWAEETPPVQRVQLRSQPLVVSEEEANTQFGLTEWDWKPLQYVQQDFEDRGETVLDHATGLLWQKAITKEQMSYDDALKYLQELNEQTFAGYDDWRLPTIPELLSLLEPTRQQKALGFYIDPIFPLPSSGHYSCWSADRRPSEGDIEWSVSFSLARVPGFDQPLNFVRAVRSVEKSLTAEELDKALGQAARYGEVEKAKALIAAGAEVDSRAFSDRDHTPLMLAAYYGDSEMMKILIAAGADVNAIHHADDTVLSDALKSGRLRAENIRLLLDAGLSLKPSPLVKAVQDLSKRNTVSERSEGLKIMRMLIEAGADVNAEEESSGLTPFVYAACIGGNPQFMELLLRSGAEIDAAVGVAGITALGCAVDMKQIETVKFLIAAGADLELADKSGKTPLMKAQNKHFEKIMKLLTDAGATR